MGINKELIRIGAKCELARRNFFYDCQLKAPGFYDESRTYIRQLCDELQKY